MSSTGNRKNIPAKYHPSPISNDEALGFFEVTPNKKKNKMSTVTI